MQKSLKVAEEVFIMTRELSYSRGARFTWNDWIRAYSSVYGTPQFSWQKKDKKHTYLHMTAGNMLRAQLQGKTITKIRPGLYQFRVEGQYVFGGGFIPLMPARPLYVRP